MVSCCCLVDQVDASRTLIIHFNNIWTRDWKFCGRLVRLLEQKFSYADAKNVKPVGTYHIPWQNLEKVYWPFCIHLFHSFPVLFQMDDVINWTKIFFWNFKFFFENSFKPIKMEQKKYLCHIVYS